MNITRRLSLGFAVAVSAVFLAVTVSADTVVASTFGSGDSYGPGAYGVNSGQSVAQMFRYTEGASLQLAQIRLVLWADANPYSIQFWHGSNMNSASLLESWTLSATTEGIYTLLSAATPFLTTGEDYWISAENRNGTTGAWSKNNRGYMGVGARFPSPSDPFPVWVIFPNPEDLTTFPSRDSVAFDVTVTRSSVPDTSATLALLGSAFLGLAALRRRFAA